MFKFTATDAGAFDRDGLGNPMAVDLLLSGSDWLSGRIRLETAGTLWEALASPGPVGIFPVSASPLDPERRLEGDAAVTITRIDFVRDDPAGPVGIGTLAFDAPITLTAWHEPNFRGDRADGWVADLGPVLAKAISLTGLSMVGGAGPDWLSVAQLPLPQPGDMILSGRGGDDWLSAGRGNDRIHGGSGDDVITDSGGSNAIRAGSGDDIVRLGAWSDASTVRGGAGSDHLISTRGADRLWGNGGDDRLEGGAGDDMLRGGRGDDRLEGGTGADRIAGGLGDDVLLGGFDGDLFIMRHTNNGEDKILDFDPAEDRIRISGPFEEADTLEFEATSTGTRVSWDGGDSSVHLDLIAPDEIGVDHFEF